MNVKLARLLTAGTLSVAVLGIMPAPAEAVVADCSTWTSGGRAYVSCSRVSGGQARVRADCSWAPDLYSSWIGSYTSAWTGQCPWGIRGAILEVRNY